MLLETYLAYLLAQPCRAHYHVQAGACSHYVKTTSHRAMLQDTDLMTEDEHTLF